jgi:hypothetical protein
MVRINLRPKTLVFVSGLVALLAPCSRGQEQTEWQIAPEKINIHAGSPRILQILDNRAQELHGALWSVDKPELAEIREEDGRAAVDAKAAGMIRVSASLGSETRTAEIRIWPADQPLPQGTTMWAMHPIGREIGDIPAVPGPGSVTMFSLEQTAEGSTYLRGAREDGIQEWAWLMPEKTRNAELICGDWLGGALVGANRADSFTLYVVSNEGKLRWRRSFTGKRTAHAYNLDHLLHIVTESGDGTAAVTGVDGRTGEQRFELPVPASRAYLNGLRRRQSGYVCEPGNHAASVRSTVSRLFVNIDGFAYVAFALSDWTFSTGACTSGATVNPGDVGLTGRQRLILWQIHPDGTRQESEIEQVTSAGRSSAPVTLLEPTHAIIPDGLGGILLSVRRLRDARQAAPSHPVEFVYRVDGDGKLVYKFPLPAYEGPLKDEMVLGENDRGFATRGSLLIAFDVHKGTESWRHDTHVHGIEVFAALADGGCLVQTPDALVNVHDAEHSVELIKGKAMMGWNGQMYVKHR